MLSLTTSLTMKMYLIQTTSPTSGAISSKPQLHLETISTQVSAYGLLSIDSMTVCISCCATDKLSCRGRQFLFKKNQLTFDEEILICCKDRCTMRLRYDQLLWYRGLELHQTAGDWPSPHQPEINDCRANKQCMHHYIGINQFFV